MKKTVLILITYCFLMVAKSFAQGSPPSSPCPGTLSFSFYNVNCPFGHICITPYTPAGFPCTGPTTGITCCYEIPVCTGWETICIGGTTGPGCSSPVLVSDFGPCSDYIVTILSACSGQPSNSFLVSYNGSTWNISYAIGYWQSTYDSHIKYDFGMAPGVGTGEGNLVISTPGCDCYDDNGALTEF